MNEQKDAIILHADAMAYYLCAGSPCEFTTARILSSGTSEDGDDIGPYIAVFPKQFSSMMMASLSGAPIYGFDIDQPDMAERLCAALNFFAARARAMSAPGMQEGV